MQQLIAILREQIAVLVPLQTKYRVTGVPNERTIRFYTTNRLVDKPLARSGGRALYGYRHLLQIIAVKYLQSQYLPLVKIRSLVENISNRDLELLIPDIAPVTATHRGITREDKRVVDNSTFQHVNNTHSNSTATSPDTGAVHRCEPAAADVWHRVEIGPGIELHVHGAALSEEHRNRLRGALLREMGVLRGWFEGREQ